MTTAVRRRSGLLLFFASLGMTLGGCDCEPPVRSLTPGFVVVTPKQLTLSPVYVGQVARGVVTATNRGETMDLSQVSVIGPFSAIPGRLGVAGGASEDIIVSFAPAFPGSAVGVLRIGTIEVPIEAEGLEVPECRSTNVCVESRFEMMGARCVEAPRPDDTACETSCVTGGCAAGTCVGRLKGCDDSNACTVDACAETTGCSHQPRICPQPAAPCQVARCDEATGCATEPAVDGTLCGPDDCLATQVDVCIAGSGSCSLAAPTTSSRIPGSGTAAPGRNATPPPRRHSASVTRWRTTPCASESFCTEAPGTSATACPTVGSGTARPGLGVLRPTSQRPGPTRWSSTVPDNG